MYKQILKSYVEKLKKEDIIKYLNNNNYKISNDEINTIYFYIKNYWEKLLDNDIDTWNGLKNSVSENTYIEIIKLYNQYKKFIS